MQNDPVDLNQLAEKRSPGIKLGTQIWCSTSSNLLISGATIRCCGREISAGAALAAMDSLARLRGWKCGSIAAAANHCNYRSVKQTPKFFGAVMSAIQQALFPYKRLGCYSQLPDESLLAHNLEDVSSCHRIQLSREPNARCDGGWISAGSQSAAQQFQRKRSGGLTDAILQARVHTSQAEALASAVGIDAHGIGATHKGINRSNHRHR